MSKTTFKTIFLAFMAIIAFASCGNDDGDWPPMKWQTEAKLDKANKIAVPAEGGEYTLRCTNYKPWIFDIEETTQGQTKTYRAISDEESHHLTTQWGEVEISGDVVRIRLGENKSFWRMYKILLTAGDVFCNIYLEQATELYTE